MRQRAFVVVALALLVALSVPASPSGARVSDEGRAVRSRSEGFRLPEGFRPAVARTAETGVYLVGMRAPSLTKQIEARGALSASAQRARVADILRSQEAAVAAAQAMGGEVRFRYARVVNGFSVVLTPVAASRLAQRPDIAIVTAASRVMPSLTSSVPFIGAPQVWKQHGAKGHGVVVSVIDTGIDYTHADFDGSGDPDEYAANDPGVIENGTFPTTKVIGGFDFVGDTGYDPFDDDPSNDAPDPDPDPIDVVGHGEHGTHVAGICCGVGVPGSIGKGVAPKAKLLSMKVFDASGATSDVVLAAIEASIDPDGDGNTNDAADVINLSLGEDYTVSPLDAEAVAAVNAVGTIFVAAAGNAGNQPSGGSAYIAGTPGNVPDAIGVASVIDEFVAQQLTVDDPTGVELPDGGPVVWQDWSVPFDADITGEIVDAREFDPTADPDGIPAPTDRMLCDAAPAGMPFDGKIALIFKGPSGAGDCFVEDKVINAQAAGAVAVVLWDGFGGLPGPVGTGGNEDQVTVPALFLSDPDSTAVAGAVSPNAPASYNEVPVSVSITADPTVIPGYDDHMSGFTSEGPTRYSSALKPDISAPGDAITSAQAGSGTGNLTIGGTSMATPHISGVAALLVELHPGWSPDRIKALMMNQATTKLRNIDGSIVSATIMGAGRVQADEAADAVSLATPGSVSLGLRPMAGETVLTRTIRITNYDSVSHVYKVSGDVRYFDFDPAIVDVEVGPTGGPFRNSFKVGLGHGKSFKVAVRFTLDPTVISEPEQEYGWFYFHPNVDGQITIEQSRHGDDTLQVPWHVAPLAASDDGVSSHSLDLTGGSASLSIDASAAAGASFADLYLLGATDPVGSKLEDDIVAIGARSFTGPTVDGTPVGVPNGTEGLLGLTWQEFLTLADTPDEPVEFVAQTAGIHSTSDMVETDVLIDVGADGVFADNAIGADAILVKLFGPGSAGDTCLFVLPSDFSACDAEYFADYSVYNSALNGVAADASALGLSNAKHVLSYSVTQCSGVFPTIEVTTCETVGDIDPATGTYGPTLDVTAPSLAIDPLVCGGFFGGADCSGADSISVDVGLGRGRGRPVDPGRVPEQRPQALGDGGDDQHVDATTARRAGVCTTRPRVLPRSRGSRPAGARVRRRRAKVDPRVKGGRPWCSGGGVGSGVGRRRGWRSSSRLG